ncbi:hypothetical protein [Sphingorhabdus sp.]
MNKPHDMSNIHSRASFTHRNPPFSIGFGSGRDDHGGRETGV